MSISLNGCVDVTKNMLIVCFYISISTLTACGGTDGNAGPILNTNESSTTLDSPNSNDLQVKADIKILFLGNSHTASGRIPATVQKILNARQKEKQVACRYIGGAFLDAFANNQRTMQLIKNGQWDIVVLQGQKISMSGKYVYSTKAAESIASIASESGAKVILFCEWGRFRAPGENDPGKKNEAARIQKIYEGIADKTGATVAPVGMAWERALSENPGWNFYAPDGNHSNETGAFFSCLVLQQILSVTLFTESEIELAEFKALKRYPAEIDRQKSMLKIAQETLAQYKTDQ